MLIDRRPIVYGRPMGRLASLVGSLVLLGLLAATPGALASESETSIVGSWSGTLEGGGSSPLRFTARVNGTEEKGTWSEGGTCHGTLVLQSISNGFHHFYRIAAKHSSCTASGIDCLMRDGSQVLDLYVPEGGPEMSGLLSRKR